MANPWLTSDDLIESVQRKITFPLSQITFTEEDILRFANEEMAISQVPSVMSFHEEYFVYREEVSLVAGKSRYPIPQRAIGMKLRDLCWKDSSGNLFEMTRISSEDKAYFNKNIGANHPVHKFYFEGNDVVLVPDLTASPAGSLVFFYYLRPNQLVLNERAAICTAFVEMITVDNASLVAGDTITINDVVFTAVVGSPSTDEFQIGGTSIITASNLVSSITLNGIISATNGSPASSVVKVSDSVIPVVSTSNTLAFSIPSTTAIEFDTVPSNITSGSLIDFLQTDAGHKTYSFDITVGSISGSIINFTSTDVPDDFKVGDYICSAHECIIPQIPTDLHTSLSERTCARILSAIGDQAGLQSVNNKIQEIEVRQGTLLDNRAEGAPQKINPRHSLARYLKMGNRRRV